MRLQQLKMNKESLTNQSIIWQVLPENSFESDLIDYVGRFFEIETIKEIDGVLTVLENEMVYHSTFLKNNFWDPDFIPIVALGYINEKGGIYSTNPIYKSLEMIKDFAAIPSAKSGITFSRKTFSEFYK
jgi:hypothetical protein